MQPFRPGPVHVSEILESLPVVAAMPPSARRAACKAGTVPALRTGGPELPQPTQ